MHITVKSNQEFFEKEAMGSKSNTVRYLGGNDTIEIINAENGESITRRITDISVFPGF